MEALRRCNGCKQDLPLSNFSKNKNSSNGYNWTCKACIKTYQLSIKDKLKAYQHEYQKVYREENKEKLNERANQWARDNPEKHRAHVAKANAKRRDKINAYMKEYRLRKKLLKQLNAQQPTS
jgi:cytochrome c biogenesis factor